MSPRTTPIESGRRGLRYPSSRYRVRRLGGGRSAGAALYVREGVLRALLEIADHRRDEHQVAFLLGGLHEDAGGHHLEVAGYADLERAPDPSQLMDQWRADWRLAHNRIRRAFPGRSVVGWAALLPGCGGKLAPRIAQVHSTFFNCSHQVCLLLDPTSRCLSFHGLDRDGRLVGIGFNLVCRSRDA